MATSQRPKAVEKQTRFMYLLMLTLNDGGQTVMKEIFNFAIGPRNLGESLTDHIMRISGMSIDEFNRNFDPVTIDLISSDPSMDSFDITTWYTLFQHGCVGLAHHNDEAWLTPGSLENNLKRIKDFRNQLMHSDFSLQENEFYKNLEELRSLLVNTVLLARSKYSLDEITTSGIISQLHSTISETREYPFEVTYFRSLDVTPLINFLKSEGQPELMNVLKQWSIVNPASLIAGRNMPMEVAEIYTPLQIVEGKRNTNETVSLDNILKVAYDNDKDIILLEGIAGVGKTTIIKKIISDWTRGGTMKYLLDYDFIIPVQCRDKGYSSVGRIVSAMMPAARKKFYEDMHMVTSLLGCKVFFILDGIDEVTHESEAILIELLEMIKTENITILLTTRPEKIQSFYNMISSRHAKVLHLRIDGVAEVNKEDFIARYHAKLVDLGISMQSNANGLLSYLRTTGARLQDQWTLPINVTLVTLLWGIDVDRILSITCPIELLIVIRNITLVRMEERVVHRIEYTLDIFDKKMKGFFSLFSEVALLGIRDSDLLIPESEIQKLRERCVSFILPTEEVFGAFLVLKKSWSSTDLFTFAHKSGQEYYAAMHIYNRVFSVHSSKQKSEDKLKSIYDFLSRTGATGSTSQGVIELIHIEKSKGKTVTDVISGVSREMSNPPSIDKYQGTLISLLGILHYHKVVLAEESAEELISLLQETGVTERQQWINVLNSVKCDPMVAKTLIKTFDNILEENGGKPVCIRDDNVFAYATLLEYREPQKVEIAIKGNPTDIPRIEELFNYISQGKTVITTLCLQHLFRHTNNSFMSYVNSLLKKCTIENTYLGQFPSEGGGDLMKSLQGSPESTTQSKPPLEECQLGLGGEKGPPPAPPPPPKRAPGSLAVSLASVTDANCLFTFLKKKAELQRPLQYLSINVGNLTSGMLQSIPEDVVEDMEVFLPDIEEDKSRERKGHQDVVDILRKLKPMVINREFNHLNFPRYQSIAASHQCDPQGGGGGGGGIRNLLQCLQGIKVYLGVSFPSRCRPSDDREEEKLDRDCKRMLQCKTGIIWKGFTDGTTADMDTWD